jgi:RNA polymerase sigma-70 factor (ECF subfamily)
MQPYISKLGSFVGMDEYRELIEGCVRGERKSQAQLYKKFSGILFAICLRYASNRVEAQDVLQEVFVRVFSNIRSFSFDGSFEGWLKRIAVNTSITHYRKNLKHAYQEDVDSAALGISDTDYLNPEYTAEELTLCIQKLPLGYRTVFNLYVLEGWMHKEISDHLGIDINTSKSQLSRAKVFLQKELIELSRIKLTNNE